MGGPRDFFLPAVPVVPPQGVVYPDAMSDFPDVDFELEAIWNEVAQAAPGAPIFEGDASALDFWGLSMDVLDAADLLPPIDCIDLTLDDDEDEDDKENRPPRECLFSYFLVWSLVGFGAIFCVFVFFFRCWLNSYLNVMFLFFSLLVALMCFACLFIL